MGDRMCNACGKKPTWNGQPHGFCGKACRKLRCKYEGCKNVTWNKQPGGLCEEHKPFAGWAGAAGQFLQAPVAGQTLLAACPGPAGPCPPAPAVKKTKHSKPDRFNSLLNAVVMGTLQARSAAYRCHCGEHCHSIPSQQRALISKIRKPGDTDQTAVLRAYTSAEEYVSQHVLYQDVNAALLLDREDLLKIFGGFVHALRLAVKEECQGGNNVNHGVVYRKVTLTVPQLQQYKAVGFKFLWPNFVSTSRRNDLVGFGDKSQKKTGQTNVSVNLVIDLGGRGTTYALDISRYSQFPHEQEVLIYPFSGFEVMDYKDLGGYVTIHLRTVDTVLIEPTVAPCPTGSMPAP